MVDKNYVCKICKCTGAKSFVPYKIVEDKDGNSVRFVGQICEKCYKTVFEQKYDGAPSTEATDKG